ncbi:mitofusin [Myotisia sp. PD_48]|nr:mitofusin [Myotisia sp. PD_48]
MSQEYLARELNSSAGEGSSRNHARRPSDELQSPSRVPGYMFVGSGSTSLNATSLITSLHQDSGYGGSVMDGHSDPDAWHAGLLEDRPTPSHTPLAPGEINHAAHHERQVIANHVHQLLYNSNRTKLGRSITKTIELLKDLQQINREWPAHYPTVQNNESPPSNRPVFSQTRSYEPDIIGSSPASPIRPESIRRAATFIGPDAESGGAVENRPVSGEPRLVTPQIAREFSILKLDLKLGALSPAELVHSLEKNSIASLLDGKISQSIKHLLSLRDRIEDTSSKVLITGDLNAGKSTFCNALLRRKILPEDQQPCTSIFCEVVDARENAGVEEVHAILKDRPYNRNDESSYDVYSLADLETIVGDNTKYMQCKVYVKDVRTIDESLLNNGVVDIALIDAPGLNSDSVKTTAVFARQEEIDVVVFVVNAANHFTLSARDFIMNAAHEKAYIFIVVNGFDNIRDTAKCQKMILDQVASLSPRTHKEAAELVHFVSSNVIPTARGGGGGGDGDNDGDGDENPQDSKGKGKEKEKIQDFENLEGALRRFVLEKRSRSKLAPARTYLLNILSDLHALATVNRDVALTELDRVSQELDEIIPAYEKRKNQRTEVSDQLDGSMEDRCNDVYTYTRSSLSRTIATVGQTDLGVQYPGILSVFQYAEDVKLAMLDQISTCVNQCEAYARKSSVEGVNMIQRIGLLHVGESRFPNLNFRSDIMFRQQRHELARQIHTDLDIWDFIDIPGLWERQEKVAGTGMAMTVVGVVGGRALGGIGWLDGVLNTIKMLGPNNVRRMLLPSIFGATILVGAYIFSQIPNSLPSSLSRKLARTLADMDYIHSNATRISAEVGRVLRVPSSRLQSALQVATEELAKRKDEVSKIQHESEIARKYFSNLFRESDENRLSVDQIDLDASAPLVE